MNTVYSTIKHSIKRHCDNIEFTNKNWEPVFSFSELSSIAIIGQAPGIKAQESNIPWNDPSGDNLREWLGVSREEFYDEDIFALIPMDFYYPGKGKSGDLPPRKNFAGLWHPQIFDSMKQLKLIILVGQYSQQYYLPDGSKTNLTQRVKNFREFLPTYFVLPHPSPRNRLWIAKNPWCTSEVLPELQHIVAKLKIGK
jgi:uracil-DNA glycosylase